jgi:hypothetical protein
LVPRVFGQTEKARQKKTVKPKEAKQWDEKTFLEELRATRGAKAALTAKEVFDWVSPQVSVMSWGTGPQNGSVIPTIKRNTTSYRLFRMATNGRFVFRFDWLKETPAFEAEASRRELLDKVNSIPGVHFSDDVLVKRARVPITTFCDGQAMQAVKSLIKWMIDRIEVVAGNERAD